MASCERFSFIFFSVACHFGCCSSGKISFQLARRLASSFSHFVIIAFALTILFARSFLARCSAPRPGCQGCLRSGLSPDPDLWHARRAFWLCRAWWRKRRRCRGYSYLEFSLLWPGMIAAIAAVRNMLCDTVVVEVAALAECSQVVALVVGGIPVQMCYGEYYPGSPWAFRQF